MEMSSFTHFHSFSERKATDFIMIIWVKVNVILIVESEWEFWFLGCWEGVMKAKGLGSESEIRLQP